MLDHTPRIEIHAKDNFYADIITDENLTYRRTQLLLARFCITASHQAVLKRLDNRKDYDIHGNTENQRFYPIVKISNLTQRTLILVMVKLPIMNP